jgi:hypothetical protein
MGPGLTNLLQAYYDAVYKGSSCIQRYHQEVNKAPDAMVTAWNGGHRTIVYTLHVDAPAFLKRIVGVDNAKVTEAQTVAFNPDGSIALCSTPAPNIPGGDKFTTQIETLLTQGTNGSCLVSLYASRGLRAGRESRQGGGRRGRCRNCALGRDSS